MNTMSTPVVPERSWPSTRSARVTLNVEQTDGGDLEVQLWVGTDGGGGGVSVLLDQIQIDELITDLVERRALLATRRATGRTP